MTEDRRAHDRIDNLDTLFRQHTDDIAKLRVSVIDNTNMLKASVVATQEVVEIMRGAKSAVALLLFLAKLAGAMMIIIGSISAFWYAFVHYIRGA